MLVLHVQALKIIWFYGLMIVYLLHAVYLFLSIENIQGCKGGGGQPEVEVLKIGNSNIAN